MSRNAQRRAETAALLKRRLRARLKARAFRARWKALGQRCPAQIRGLAYQNALNATRRALGLCPDCGIETGGRFVYCLTDRVRRAKNLKRLWLRKKQAEAARQMPSGGHLMIQIAACP